MRLELAFGTKREEMIVLTRRWVARLVGFPDREYVGVDRRVELQSLPDKLAVAVVG